MDPREALLNIEFDGFGFGKDKKPRRSASAGLVMDESDENALLQRVERQLLNFEEEHDQRFRGIEIHIKWLMALVLGEVVAIVGFAISTIGGG